MIQLKTQSSHVYPIVETSVFSDWIHQFFFEKSFRKAYVIVDEHVWRFHQSYIQKFFNSISLDVLNISVVPSGESSKSIKEWQRLTDELLQADCKRNDVICVFGGGVTGDLGGFAASTALRGIPLVHFPTTVLAMVDSAIGGKTGINHSTGKNRIGAFYQPEAVICDVHFLTTLPKNEWFCGLGEVLKYACISDQQLVVEITKILQKSDDFMASDWAKIIEKSASIKAHIVAQDEREMGIRAYLNFGHTFAHAIEHELGYGTMSHGDAVFWGCIAACELSRLQGASLKYLLESFIPFYKPRVVIPNSVENLVQAMYADKKNKSAEITFVLLKAFEQPYLGKVTDLEHIHQAWKYMLSLMR